MVRIADAASFGNCVIMIRITIKTLGNFRQRVTGNDRVVRRFGRALVAFVLTFSATAFLTYYSTLVGWILLKMHPAVVSWALSVALEAFGVPLLMFFVVLRFWPDKKKVKAVAQRS